jgi:hypothetical protein
MATNQLKTTYHEVEMTLSVIVRNALDAMSSLSFSEACRDKCIALAKIEGIRLLFIDDDRVVRIADLFRDRLHSGFEALFSPVLDGSASLPKVTQNGSVQGSLF